MGASPGCAGSRAASGRGRAGRRGCWRGGRAALLPTVARRTTCTLLCSIPLAPTRPHACSGHGYSQVQVIQAHKVERGRRGSARAAHGLAGRTNASTVQKQARARGVQAAASHEVSFQWAERLATLPRGGVEPCRDKTKSVREGLFGYAMLPLAGGCVCRGRRSECASWLFRACRVAIGREERRTTHVRHTRCTYGVHLLNCTCGQSIGAGGSWGARRVAVTPAVLIRA